MKVTRKFGSLGNKDTSKPFKLSHPQHQSASIPTPGFRTNAMPVRLAPMNEPHLINMVTAVSRPENLLRIKKSAELSLARSSLTARWYIVVDGEGALPPAIESALQGGRVEVRKTIHDGGSCRFGIAQKNLGMQVAGAGFFHCLDDDNLVHPDFFTGVQRAMEANPSKRAFVFSQRRWGGEESLVASPHRMQAAKIDNTMFVVHSSLIANNRYDLQKAGLEDFYFFRKLYDQHRDEFVFLPETLAFYNYIRHFPQEMPEESGTGMPAPAVPAQVAERHPRIPGVHRIALYSSKRERCGISTYTSHLEEALASMGHEVRHYGSRPPYEQVFDDVLAWRPDVFHIQHEVSIMPPDEFLQKRAEDLRRHGVKVAITLHTANEGSLRVGRLVTASEPGRIVTHMRLPKNPDAVFMPMPCTNVGVLPRKEASLRKFGFPPGAFVVSTIGFMIPWKEHAKIAEAMLPWLRQRPEVHLQIMASEHFSPDLRGYSIECRDQIAEIAGRIGGNRIHHVSDYPSDTEIVERLAVSDLGYLWCPFDTYSSSAAAAQFTSARCPLVVSDSTHYAFLGSGIVRCKMGNLSAFADMVRETADNPQLLRTLKENQSQMYRQRNYAETARAHLALYGLPV